MYKYEKLAVAGYAELGQRSAVVSGVRRGLLKLSLRRLRTCFNGKVLQCPSLLRMKKRKKTEADTFVLILEREGVFLNDSVLNGRSNVYHS